MRRKLASFSGFVVGLAFCFLFSGQLFASQEGNSQKLEALKKLTKTLNTVEKYYVDDINYTTLVNKSIAGLLSNLDAHSSFMNEKDFKAMQESTNGEFGGLGITVGMKDGAITVIAPLEGTPADKAGLKSGDVIVKINNTVAIGMSLSDAVDKMRGKAGTKIKLTLVRKGLDKPFSVEITREIIKVKSVYSKLIPSSNILYIRVTTFDKNVSKQVAKALRTHPKVAGVILDLRNNPGGLLNQAVGLVNLFVSKGVIVSQKGRLKSDDESYKANPDKKLSSKPLVVLINGGSASASEIVSGALQDLHRAVLVGEKSFGKGSVQLIIPIANKEALRLTIARYYLPSGRSIQSVGVSPDIEVFPGAVNEHKSSFEIKEADLKQHLLGELKKNKEKAKVKADKNTITKEQISKDAQLKSAIDAIKVLTLKEK